MHPEVRRAVRSLGASYALAWVAISMTVGPGPAAYVRLSGDLGAAGLFLAFFALGTASGGILGGQVMDRVGRRPVLAAAHLVAAAGYAAAGVGVAQGSLPLFVLGLLALSTGMGAVYLTRVAAAELFPPALRGRGMAGVLVSATAGAIAGPLLLVASEPLGGALGQDPRELVWFLAPPLLLVAALLVARAPEPRDIARDLARFHPGVPLDAPRSAAAAPPPRHLLFTGVAALALAHGAMVAVMGIAGPAVQQHGHGFAVLGAVMAFHFVGMFALSTVVGKVADRVGRRGAILAGLASLAAGAVVLAAVPTVEALAVGLLVVGLGWSFAYVGSTVLLTDITPLATRARTLGRADFVSSLAQAGLAAAGGWWFAQQGLLGLGVVMLVALALPAGLVLLLREGRPGSYEDRVAPRPG